jgi:DNA repair photolyase
MPKYSSEHIPGMHFEKEQGRILTYGGTICPLGCKYCFDEPVDRRGLVQLKSLMPLSAEGKVQPLPDEVSVVVPYCNTDLFIDRNEAKNNLAFWSHQGKDVAVSTKVLLSEKDIDWLLEIQKAMAEKGNIFVLSSSIPCLGQESAHHWEPDVAAPEKRVEALKLAHQKGLNNLVAIRPLLPDVNAAELEEIVSKTREFCSGYFAGSLRLKRNDPLLADLAQRVSNLQVTKEAQVSWMPPGNEFCEVVRPGQDQELQDIIANHHQKLFAGVVDGVNFIKQIKK